MIGPAIDAARSASWQRRARHNARQSRPTRFSHKAVFNFAVRARRAPTVRPVRLLNGQRVGGYPMLGKSKGNAGNYDHASSVQHMPRPSVASPRTPEGSSISAGLSIVGKVVGDGAVTIFLAALRASYAPPPL